MSQPSPLSYKEIAHTVEDYLTKCDRVKGWHLDATEPISDDVVNYFPFAEQKNVGVHLSYRSSALNLLTKCAVSVNPSSWFRFLPTFEYNWARDNIAQTIEFACSSTTLKYTASHPVFHAEVHSLLADGGSGSAAVSTCLTKDALLGMEVHYDPRRSGLKDFTVLAVQNGCPAFSQGDILAKYSFLRGLGLHLRVPVSSYLDAAVISESQRFIVGCQGRSPCGPRCSSTSMYRMPHPQSLPFVMYRTCGRLHSHARDL
ncbi:hypothetical protein STCU_01047 [Strigomonas culicis]|uniref:Uncharacterized protein n=1 Tax=Strigomonas culicis TaxID=28005 RepID=S9UXP5_9TRYP|nr:hypothetical protein STCU_01047 [Strigomonas culicis]|eukprot:EPY35627.1 hypothetical protein STCU_01047 [Strigomonas culicis]